MRKVQLNGSKIKELRDRRDRGSTQKEFAHEIRISERRLRAIENENAPVPSEVADRIARTLNMPLAILTDAPEEMEPPVPPEVSVPQKPTLMKRGIEEILPRFDEMYASVVSDEAKLFEMAKGNRTVISHILTALSSETSAYAEEMLALLRSVTWDARGTTDPIDGMEEIGLRRRLRELLVLLKGNDVWVYADSNIKTLPESFEVQPHSNRADYEFQAIVAFGPPGEYGETSLKVPFDRGQPCLVTW